MKMNEVRELTVDELNQKINEARKGLFDARFKHSLHQLENTAELRQLKHRIAQMQTALKEKAQPQETKQKPKKAAGGRKK